MLHKKISGRTVNGFPADTDYYNISGSSKKPAPSNVSLETTASFTFPNPPKLRRKQMKNRLYGKGMGYYQYVA